MTEGAEFRGKALGTGRRTQAQMDRLTCSGVARRRLEFGPFWLVPERPDQRRTDQPGAGAPARTRSRRDHQIIAGGLGPPVLSVTRIFVDLSTTEKTDCHEKKAQGWIASPAQLGGLCSRCSSVGGVFPASINRRGHWVTDYPGDHRPRLLSLGPSGTAKM